MPDDPGLIGTTDPTSQNETSFIRIPKPGKGLYIPFATVGLVASAFTGAWQMWERWELHKTEEIQAAIKHAQEEKALEERLRKLERWQCRLGWNPPTTRNAERDCGKEEE